MNNSLESKIEEEQMAVGDRDGQPLVSLDASNVVNWQVYQVAQDPNNENASISEAYRISVPKLARFLRDLEPAPYVKFYSPYIEVSSELMSEIIDWARLNAPEILHNLSNYSGPFISKLARSVSEYMSRHADDEKINDAIRSRMQRLTRGNNWEAHKRIFLNEGFDVVHKPVSINKPLRDDYAHSSAVSRIVYNAQRIENQIVEIANLEGFDRALEKKVRATTGRDEEETEDDYTEFDRETDETFADILAKLPPEYSAAITKMIQEEVGGRVLAILKSTQQIMSVLASPSGKIDLDPDLVAGTLDPKVLAKHQVFVNYSGDGDFVSMYNILHEQGKRIIVVSPQNHLSNLVKTMAQQGKLRIHNPDFTDDVWRRVQPNKRKSERPSEKPKSDRKSDRPKDDDTSAKSLEADLG